MIVWILVTNSNNRHNEAINKKMSRIVEGEVAGEMNTETQEPIRDGDQYKNRVILMVIAVIILIIYLKSR